MKIVVSRDSETIQEIDLSVEANKSVGDSLSFFVGRSNECQVVLDDPQVSREHAQLDFKNGNWTIKQISQFGKIQINGSSVETKDLHPGDVAIIGPFVVSFFPSKPETSSRSSIQPEGQTYSADEATKTQMNEEHLPEANSAIEDETQFLEQDFATEEGLENEDVSQLDDEMPIENEDSGFISGGAQSVEFSAENNETAFPEENELDEIESFESTQSDFNSLDVLDDTEDGFDDESTKVLQTFAKFQLDLFGEFAPYDKYNLENAETTIGRDPSKCQIILNDPEVSSVHAKIVKNNITCTIEDMQSGNGTLLNGERINKSPLTNGDEFIIGSTTFTVRIVSDFLEQEQERLMPVEENQVVEIEEIVEVDADFEDGDLEEGASSFGDAQVPAGNQSLVDKFRSMPPKKQLIYGFIGIALAFLLLDGFETEPKPPEPKEAQAPAQASEEEKVEEAQAALSPEILEIVEASYQLANTYIQRGMYDEALQELDNNIFRYTPKYKNADQLKELALAGIQERERIEARRQKEIREAERREKVKDLVERAKVAVKERNVLVAEELFAQIAIIDPDNFDVSALKIELDAWKKEEERKAVLAAQKEAERKRMIDLLKPGKEAFLRQEWYNSTIRLQQFLDKDNMDEDLIEEAAQMLTKAQEELDTIVGPLLGRARSLREGQDLKGAYELYGQILTYHPANGEAMDEMREIREVLTLRSRKVYREAIIAESLSLLQDAKEKFQEVQQISPTDSEYYIKATNKLKDYVE